MRPDRFLARPGVVPVALAGIVLVFSLLFLFQGARGNWDFVLGFRAVKLATMLLVGYAIAVSTVLFQTVIGNRILTPGLMGFEALYGLIQTLLIFLLGASLVAGMDPRVRFGVEVLVMVTFSILLYRGLFTGAARSLHLVMLVGIILGVLFRGVSSFFQRVMDPNAFLVAQDRLFASFNRPDPELLTLSAVVVALLSLLVWRWIRVLDVLVLGRDLAVNLGVDHRRAVTGVLLVVSVLVAVSTALVGPITFLGLLVANVAYMLTPSRRHARILPVAALVSIAFLVVGQFVLERLFKFETALGIVIEFTGGLFFLFLLTRGMAR